MNVFKKLTFVTLLLVGSNLCFAQEISIRGGFNLSEFNLKAGDHVIHREGTKLNPGYHVGPIVEFPIKSIFSFETGILFSLKGYKLSGDIAGVENYLFKFNMFYSEVPVMLKATYPIGKTKIFGMAGGYAASALWGHIITGGIVNSVEHHDKNKISWGNTEGKLDRMDYGLKFGVGLKIKDCQFGASYGIGLKDFWNGGTIKNRNRVLEFYMAYKIKSFKQKTNI
jgi:hypothetical protein